MKLRMLGQALALGMIVAASSGAQVVNGGFESSIPVTPGTFTTYSATQNFGGWTVGSGSIDLINGFWQAASGTYSVDLDGASVGSIYQDLVTSLGGTYNLSFALAGNSAGGPLIKSMDVFWGSTNVGTFTFDVTGKSPSNMGWQNFVVNNLTATSATTRLTFQSTTNGNVYGPALDDVIVSQATTVTPEPASMMLVAPGFVGVFGLARRKRKIAA